MIGGVPELPSGTVTFVFTDVEGSTRLIEELGEDGYLGALAGRFAAAAVPDRLGPQPNGRQRLL
jgi:class 3 adenylate cyclase